MCAASGSALGKEKIKMKKEVVKIKKYTLSNNFLTMCIILYNCFVCVIEMLTNCKQVTEFIKFVQLSPFFSLFVPEKP